MKISNIIIVSMLTFIFLGCATTYNNQIDLNTMTKKVCNSKNNSSSPWNINNLYDCKTKSFFIPYQLWSGAEFDGDKKKSINHQVNKKTLTPYGNKGKLQPLSIIGTRKWISPEDNIEYNIYIRERSRKGKIQYFTANTMGIGRVYDNRDERYYTEPRMKFPAGHGWRLHEQRSLGITDIEIIDMTFNNNILVGITFKWWLNGNLDHIYHYKVNEGVVTSLKQ